MRALQSFPEFFFLGGLQSKSSAIQPSRQAVELRRRLHLQTQVQRSTRRNTSLLQNSNRVIHEVHDFVEPEVNLEQRLLIDFDQKGPACVVLGVRVEAAHVVIPIQNGIEM